MLFVLSLTSVAHVQEGEHEGQSLGQAASDPTASLMNVQLSDWYTSSYWNLPGESANQFVVRSAYPFKWGNTKHIMRVTVPFITEHPALSNGLSDMTLFDLVVFDKPWGRWGVGPVALLPTGGSKHGTEKWGLGPAFGFVVAKPKLIMGIFNQNIFTVAGEDTRPDVNVSIIQPIVNHQLGAGWAVELIANTAPNVKNYKATLPRAYYTSVIFVIVLYILIAMVTVGALAPDKIAGAADFALAEAARPSLGQLGFTLVAISAVLATFSAINATLYGSARLAYTIAEEGELPAFLEKKLWNQPVAGLLLTTLFALLLANIADLSSISTMGSAGFLVIFASVNAANFVKSTEANSNRFIAGLGVIACLFALGALVFQTLQTAPEQLWVLVTMLAIAFAIEAVVISYHRKQINRHY